MPQSFYTSQVPDLNDLNDGAPGLITAGNFRFSEPGVITHVRFYSTATVGGTYTGAVWLPTVEDDPGPGDGTLLEQGVLGGSPTPVTWTTIALDSPVPVTAGPIYRAGLLNTQGRYVATPIFHTTDLVNGSITSVENDSPFAGGTIRNGNFAASGTLIYPENEFNRTSYFIDVVFVPDSEGGYTPVTSTLTSKWRVYGRITNTLTTKWRVYARLTSTLTSKWRVYGRITSAITAKWRVFGRVTSPLTVKWRLYGRVTSTITGKWRVLGRAASTLTAKWRVYQSLLNTLKLKWRVFGETPEPPVVTSRYLTTQRRLTQLLINDDPTTAQFIPVVREDTTSGGFQEVDQTARLPQTFKLSLLAYDQRPTLTVAGVERVIDYHLIGLHDMQIEIGDYWQDEAGTRYEVAGFSEGWDYMTKAFIFRRIPREANP